MAYIVNKTDGSQFTIINDGEKKDPRDITGVCSLFLIGKNYATYGEFQNENFIRLLENSANTAAPLNPLRGQLWYDTQEKKLKVYSGTRFKILGTNTTTNAPTVADVGDFWWDTTNYQLYVYDGTEWLLVGPAYSSKDGKSGMFVEKLADSDNNLHTVISTYISNRRQSILSNDDVESFTLMDAIDGFGTKIYRGLNLANGLSSQSIGQGYNNTLSILNSFNNANVDIRTNVNGTIRSALHVRGSTGLVTVLGDPTENLGIATKQYVLNQINNTIPVWTVAGRTGNITLAVADIAGAAPIASPTLTGIPISTTASVGTSSNQIATTAFVQTQLSATIPVWTVVGRTGNILLSYTDVSGAAPIDSPTFTSIPRAPTADSHTNTTQLATTQFVQTLVAPLISAATVSAFYAPLDSATLIGTPRAPTAPASTNTTQIATTAFATGAITALSNTLTSAIAAKSPTDSPTFTGTPAAPTPVVGTNTTQLATTAFVQSQLATTVKVTSVAGKIGAVTLGVGDISGAAPIDNPAFGGTPTAATASAGTNTTQLATTAFVQTAVNPMLTKAVAATTYAPINNPGLTGTPTAPTPVVGTNTTQIATTAFVQSQLAFSIPVTSVVGRTGAITLGVSDISGAAPISNPAFSGTPTAPPPVSNSNSNQIATTAFVQTAVAPLLASATAASTYAPIVSPGFSGTPTAPTPGTSDNSGKLATTSFVQNILPVATNVKWKGSDQFVSTSLPTNSDGNDGDIWFQI